MKSARTVVLLVTCSILPVPALKAQSPPPGGSSAANPHDAGAKLPAVVLSAFRQAHPTAVITNVEKEREHGHTVWEVESLDAGLGPDLLYDASGTVTELEEEIPVAQLPALVSGAVATTYPKATITKAEKVTRGQIVTYELSMKGAPVLSVQMTPDGRPFKATAPAQNK